MPHRAQATLQLLTFELDTTVFAIELARVLEVLLRVEISPLPGAPSVVLGGVRFRGALYPLVDTRARLGFAPREPALGDHFIVARGAQRTLVLCVDRCADVIAVERASLQQLDVTSAHLRGVARVDERFVLLHNLDALLTESEERALDGAIGAP